MIEKERSWINSCGEFVVLPATYCHKDYVKFLNSCYDSIEDAFLGGWARVVGIGADLYVCRPKFINDELMTGISCQQRSALVDLCISLGKTTLMFDDEYQEKVIWSISDKI